MPQELAYFSQEEVDAAIQQISRNKAIGVDCLCDNLQEGKKVRIMINSKQANVNRRFTELGQYCQ